MKTTQNFILVTLLFINIFTLNSAKAIVNKSQRRLVIVSSLKTVTSPKYIWLYKFLDSSTITMGKMLLQSSYREIKVLPANLARLSYFKNTLQKLTRLNSVKAVDVILSLHGNDNLLQFTDNQYSTEQIKQVLQTIPNRNKFRTMYNLACFAQSHNNEFIDSGFRTSIGALQTNAASASEYPIFLSMYRSNKHVKAIFKKTNKKISLIIADNAARMMGFSNVNSKKKILGFKYATIKSNSN